MKKLISGFSALLVIAVAAPAISFAQTAGTSTLQAQLDLIAGLMKQIQTLQSQLNALQTQKQTAVAQFVNSLRLGSQGDQVSMLQALLAADPSLYPEGTISGFFGPATMRAVKRFQKQHELPQVGVVGPKTLERLNEMLDEHPLNFESVSNASGSQSIASGENDQRDTNQQGRGEERRLCAIVPPGHLIAPGWLRKHDGERPIVPQCQTLPPGIVAQLGNSTSTATSTANPAPVISSVVSSASTTSATISWSTNEAADSEIAYGLTPAYGSSTVDGTLVTSHLVTLSGLAASTAYHFSVTSKDASGKIATSSDQTFTTSAAPVVVLPVISSLNSAPASTSAVISWTTNEPTVNLVYYSTINGFSPASTSTLSVNNPVLTTSVSLSIPSLTASTTYFFVAQSTDANGHVATSSQQSFMTTQ